MEIQNISNANSWKPMILKEDLLHLLEIPEYKFVVDNNALTFRTADLINLTSEELNDVIIEVRDTVLSIASENGLTVEPGMLEKLSPGEKNLFIHELAHAHTTLIFRPKGIEVSTIRMVIYTPGTNILRTRFYFEAEIDSPLSLVEYAHVLLAPNYPSYTDYLWLIQRIMRSPDTTIEDLEDILDIVDGKADSELKKQLAEYLKSLTED